MFSPTGQFVVDVGRGNGPPRYMKVDMQTSQVLWDPCDLHTGEILRFTRGADGSLGISEDHAVLAWLPSGVGIISCDTLCEPPDLYCSLFAGSLQQS